MAARAVVLAVLALLAGAATAHAAPYAAFSVDTPDATCTIGSCTATVVYYNEDAQAVRVQVDFDHPGENGATGFAADTEVTCPAAPLDADGYPTGDAPPCRATSPPYQAAGTRWIAVHVIAADGSDAYATREFYVDKAVSQQRPPATRPPVVDDGCQQLKLGEQCGQGHGRQTAGGSGTGKVSHKGWPPITGVLWKVLTNGRGKHSRVGTTRNDELLGHHGDDTVDGGAGDDVLWADWDPANNNGSQRDVLRGGAGKDWLYTSHGRNTISGGAGDDHIWAFYGRGTIDCGPGYDVVRVHPSRHAFKLRGCEKLASGF